MKSKSLCVSYPLPICGPRKSNYEGIVSAEGAGREIIRSFCKSFWRHCKCREEIACNGAYSAVTNGIQWLQQEMTERELTILSSISKVPINNRKHSCSTFPASSYCQELNAQSGQRVQLFSSFFHEGSRSRLCHWWNPAVSNPFQSGAT